jgi:molybdenum cofactor guanylyltransferase
MGTGSLPGPYHRRVSGSAGVVLAGGRSSRMGTPKSALEWHGSTLLRRTVGILARVTDGPVVVVRAPGQELPALPPQTEVVEDPREGLGPVQGLAAGLAAVADRAEVAFVSSTDMPFLHPAFVRRVLRAVADGVDVGLPVARGYPQPLAASYRVALAPVAAKLVAEERLRPAFLFEECVVDRLDEDALRADPVLAALDPGLDSVVNVNEPGDYQAARERPAPEVTIQRFGPLADGHRGPEQVLAATVAEAAAAAGIALDGHVVAALNGDQITRDGETPLAAGDSVFFLSADAGG